MLVPCDFLPMHLPNDFDPKNTHGVRMEGYQPGRVRMVHIFSRLYVELITQFLCLREFLHIWGASRGVEGGRSPPYEFRGNEGCIGFNNKNTHDLTHFYLLRWKIKKMPLITLFSLWLARAFHQRPRGTSRVFLLFFTLCPHRLPSLKLQLTSPDLS